MGLRKERSKAFIIAHSKKISLFVLFVAIVFSFFMVSRNITGFTAYTGEIETGLEEAQKTFNSIIQEREECYSGLAGAQESYNKCQGELSAAQTNLDICSTVRADLEISYSLCQQAAAEMETELQAQKGAYDALAANSVRGLCCSFSDFQNAVVKQWSIKNDSIVCSGNFTVNCTSGEVSR